jgi:hypothetical protein
VAAHRFVRSDATRSPWCVLTHLATTWHTWHTSSQVATERAGFKSGTLYKYRPWAEGVFADPWARRFISLIGNTLMSYRSEHDVAHLPRSTVTLDEHCTVLARPRSHLSPQHSPRFYSPQTHALLSQFFLRLRAGSGASTGPGPSMTAPEASSSVSPPSQPLTASPGWRHCSKPLLLANQGLLPCLGQIQAQGGSTTRRLAFSGPTRRRHH